MGNNEERSILEVGEGLYFTEAQSLLAAWCAESLNKLIFILVKLVQSSFPWCTGLKCRILWRWAGPLLLVTLYRKDWNDSQKQRELGVRTDSPTGKTLGTALLEEKSLTVVYVLLICVTTKANHQESEKVQTIDSVCMFCSEQGRTPHPYTDKHKCSEKNAGTEL